MDPAAKRVLVITLMSAAAAAAAAVKLISSSAVCPVCVTQHPAPVMVLTQTQHARLRVTSQRALTSAPACSSRLTDSSIFILTAHMSAVTPFCA